MITVCQFFQNSYRLLVTSGALLVCFAWTATAAAEKNIAGGTQNPTNTEGRFGQRPAKGPDPKRDPAGQLFRAAAMAEASRTIAIPLATNLHVAFDSELLRIHTVWAGPGLNLFGPPYHGAKSPFLSTHDGAALWTTPPFFPWSLGSPPPRDASERPAEARFKGIQTRNAEVTLSYELHIGTGRPVQIRETPSRFSLAGDSAVLRRIEIEPCSSELWFLAQAEMAKFIEPNPPVQGLIAIQRTNDFLVIAMRGSNKIEWRPMEKDVAYGVRLNVERKGGESEVDTIPVSGRQARAYLRIPAHVEPVVIEVATALCRDAADVSRLTETLGPKFVQVPVPLSSHEKPGSAPSRPEIFSGDRFVTKRSSGDEFYKIEHFPVPKEINLLVTGMDWLRNGDLAVCTWAGEIYIVEKPDGAVEKARYRRFARGLNEPLGVKAIGDDLYVVQKSELTRVRDSDGNGEADVFETISNAWGYTGNYHAFAFGPVVDRGQNFYTFLCGQRGRWDVPYVGWCVKISPDGQRIEGFTRGLRAPNGFGTYGPDEDLFIADNQGNWVGACKLNHLRRDKFYGYPSGTPAPKEEYEAAKTFEPPAVWFPRKLSPSTSGFVTIPDERFGPFKGQMLIGDFQNAVVQRVFLEKVNGEWQGAVWPFSKGYLSGVNRLLMGRDGKLYVGGLKNSAWAAAAPKEYSLDRVSFTGRIPVEVQEMHALPTGFELKFTKPMDKATAENTENYDVAQFTYLYHQTYGSPEIDHDGKKDSSTAIKVTKAVLSNDHVSVQLTLEGWKTGYVTAVRALDLKSAEGEELWHDTLYYTLNQIPKL